MKIENLVVPEANLLGGEGMGFAMGQHRLAYGRLRHGMHNVAMAQRALDLATEHVTKRSTFGKGLEDRQGVQFMLAECASQLYIARLMLMHIAYKAENGMDIRQENGIAKVFLANMVHKVVDTAIQLHGALGYSLDTPLAAWYTHIRSQRLVDGPDEVHKWITGKNVIRAFKRMAPRLLLRRRPPLIRLTFCLRRLPHLSARRSSATGGKPMPAGGGRAKTLGIVRYEQVHAGTTISIGIRASRDAPEPYDGIAEIWFESEAAMRAAGQNPGAAAAAAELLEDERKFIDLANSPLWFNRVHTIVG